MSTPRRATDALRVGFDDQIFEAQRRGGISRAFVELIPRLRQFGIDPVVLSTGTRNAHLIESGIVPERPARSLPDHLAWATWRVTGRPRSTPKPPPPLDVLHHTFTHGAYLSNWDGPRVVTIPDMIPELFPRQFRLGNPHFAKKRYAEVSDAIITVSHNSATDMYRVYSPELESRTHVIPNGVSDHFFERASPGLDLPDRYLLFVGVRGGYKRFDLALEAFARIAQGDDGLFFVVVGGGPFTRRESADLARLDLERKVVRLSPTDLEMPEIYRRAAAFVFPSSYEGFGIPTIESLASGTPVVLADTSVSREIGADAAIYARPGDADSLTSQVRAAMAPEHHVAVATRGPEIAERYRWNEVARATAEVYRSIA